MKYYAIGYTKYWLHKEYVIFVPICVLNGNYDEIVKQYIDDNDDIFSDIKDYEAILNSTDFYGHLISEDSLKDLYSSDDIENILNDYFDEACDSVFVGKLDEQNKSVELYELPLSRIKGLTRPVTYSVNDKGSGEVKLSKEQISSLCSENDIEKIQLELIKYMKNAKSAEMLNAVIGVKAVTLDSTNQYLKGFNVSTTTLQAGKLKQAKNTPYIPNGENKALATYKYITERLVGQDDAVEDIVGAVINNINATDPKEIIKPFIIGPTGSGKSLLFKLLGECLNVPVITVDCNLLVQAGYEGKDINDVLKDLYHICEGNTSKMEHAIVMFDEVDKIANAGAGVSDVGVQQALLKFIEGNEYVVELSRIMGDKVTINTSMMTIVAGGAFDSLTSYKKRQGLGFGSGEKDIKSKKIGVESLQEYGMISEFIGRFNLFVQYNEVTKEMLYKALVESEISPIKIRKKYYCDRYGVKITFNDAFIKRVCEEAIKNRAGFRGLEQTVNGCLSKLNFKLQCEPNAYSEIIITEEILDNPRSYQYIKK